LAFAPSLSAPAALCARFHHERYTIDVLNVFYVFYSGHFLRFLTFIIFSTFLIFEKALSNAKYEYAKIQRKILLAMIFIGCGLLRSPYCKISYSLADIR